MIMNIQFLNVGIQNTKNYGKIIMHTGNMYLASTEHSKILKIEKVKCIAKNRVPDRWKKLKVLIYYNYQ